MVRDEPRDGQQEYEAQVSPEQLQGEGDRFLVEEMRAGSAEAFRRLVDRFSGRLTAYASRKLHGSGLDPEDAVQEAFVSLVRSLDRLEGVRSLQAYLFTILRWRIADLARERGPTAGAISLDGAPGSGRSSGGLTLASPESTPSTYARRDEAVDARRVILADVIESLLERIKEEKKFRDLMILELLFSLGVSQQEAARLARTSESTISRVRKSLIEQLRKLVAEHAKVDAIEDLPSGEGGRDGEEAIIASIWQENLFSCVKRSTLGSYALDVLDEEWADYVRFHLSVVKCEYCVAHLADVEQGDKSITTEARERIFTSSVGFLR